MVNVGLKILVEKYLRTNDGFAPKDYKIYCFDVNAKGILIITDCNSAKKLAFIP